MVPKFIFPLDCCCCGANMGATTAVEVIAFHEVFCRECIRSLGHAYIDWDINDLFDDKDNAFLQTLKAESYEVIYNHPQIPPEARWWEASDNISVDIPDALSDNSGTVGVSDAAEDSNDSDQ